MIEKHEAEIAFRLRYQEWSVLILKVMMVFFASFIAFLIGEEHVKKIIAKFWRLKDQQQQV